MPEPWWFQVLKLQSCICTFSDDTVFIFLKYWFYFTWSLFFNSTSSSSFLSGYNSKKINLQKQFIKSCLKTKPSSVHAWSLISHVSMCLRMPKQNHKKKVFFLFRPTQLKDVKLCTMYPKAYSGGLCAKPPPGKKKM